MVRVLPRIEGNLIGVECGPTDKVKFITPVRFMEAYL